MRPEWPSLRWRSIASPSLVLLCALAGCSPETSRSGNTELNVVVPNGFDAGSSAPALIDIVDVEYTIDCTGNSDAFLDNEASFDDAVTLNGNLEVQDGRTNAAAIYGDPAIDGQAEIWQGFMDLPPGPCSIELRARDNDDEVICTAQEPFNIAADSTTKVNIVLICDISFQAPVGMLDVDGTFSFNVGNFCPDLFILNCLDSAPVEQQLLPPPNPALAGTQCELRFRDGDSSCGAGCDPQTCVPNGTSGLICTPGPDPGVSTTVTCTDAWLDCDGDGVADPSCTWSDDTLGALGQGPAGFPGAPPTGTFFVTCIPPALGGIPGQQVTCTAVTTDGDLDCNKTKVATIDCPGLPPCDPSLIDCDDGNPCTTDACDPSSGVGVCVNDPLPAGTLCVDPAACSSPFPGSCDGAGTCAYQACVDDAVCDDGNPCTANSCDLVCGLCAQATPVADGTQCDAGLGVASGACVAGACEEVCSTFSCPDNGIACMTDVCNPLDGSCTPTAEPDGATCDPPGGTAGTGACEAGVCADPLFAEFCFTPLAFDEQMCNPTYDDTAWPGSHRGSYAQGSSAGPGPAPGATVTPQHIELPGAPIIVSFSEPYADGGRAAWATILGLDAAILKVDHDTFQIIDTYIPALEEPNPPVIPVGVSGAYAAVDAGGNFIVGRTNFMAIFRDSVPGDRSSPIELNRRVLFLPGQGMCNSNDSIAGMALTYDGHIAFATELGNLFVVPVDAEQGDVFAGVPVVSTNPNCATADPSTLETVSNSIATDENGGIYMVTSAAMYGFDWDGSNLTQSWRVPYDSDPNVSPIRLGAGSGQTPSLMGTKADDDRFVVIGDGKQLMNLILYWRDDIPPGWQPIGPGKDPRIACEVPIQFGDPSATSAISEQSIAVRGYGAIVVNDLLTNPAIVPPGTSNAQTAQNLVSALEGGLPAKAPLGIERVNWDPVTQTCATVWANATVSIPNGIPSISEESNLVYGIGQRAGQWGVEALDYDTGASVLWAPGGTGFCDPALIAPARLLSPVDAVLDEEVIPGSGVTLDQTSCENSVYAATTVAPDGAIYTGTFFGMSKYSPDVVPAPSQSVQAHAGIDQALDLLGRAQSALVGGPSAARDYVGRAYQQITASAAPVQVTGPPLAYTELLSAATAVQQAFALIESSLDPSTQISAAIIALNTADALLN